jgi:hypothetical protein
MRQDYLTGNIITPAGNIPLVSTRLTFSDRLGAIRVRWLIRRNNYRVDPGLYGTGSPDNQSDVFVTANYKLSFDHLRKNLDGMSAWILVLDTKGVNVWCAAGKGTFGTRELVNRIHSTNLKKIISHNRIIVPQLGATGVSAYKVKELTAGEHKKENLAGKPSGFDFSTAGQKLLIDRGFDVIFGPVRAADIRSFLQNKYRTTDEMRKVHFTFTDRLKLVPVDLVYARYQLLIAFAVILIISVLGAKDFIFQHFIERGVPSIIRITLAYIAGIVITPLLLPYIPVKMFAFKGLISGIFLCIILLASHNSGTHTMEVVSWFFLIAAVSSFMAMNFTGASTFTSLSGVKKEMRVFVPIQITLAAAGLILLTINNLFLN